MVLLLHVYFSCKSQVLCTIREKSTENSTLDMLLNVLYNIIYITISKTRWTFFFCFLFVTLVYKYCVTFKHDVQIYREKYCFFLKLIFENHTSTLTTQVEAFKTFFFGLLRKYMYSIILKCTMYWKPKSQ